MKKKMSLLLAMVLLCLPCMALGQTYMVIDTLRLPIPEGGTVIGAEVYGAQMRPAMHVQSYFFDESVFMEEYGFTTQEQCVRSVIDNISGITVTSGGIYPPGVNGYTLYGYHCTAVKHMPPDGELQQSSEPMMLAMLIDAPQEMVYAIFFYGELAQDQTVVELLSNVSAYTSNQGERALEGLYPWEGGADYYLD